MVAIMSVSTDTIKCSDCGTIVDGCNDTPEQRTRCGKCGSTKRTHQCSITETVIARDGIGMKAKRTGEKKPYIEDLAKPDYSKSLDKLVYRERIIDRDNDQYYEKLTDYESGEVIHHCKEPLSQHQGHGAAKSNNNS
jgi:ribosomal protein S27AE